MAKEVDSFSQAIIDEPERFVKAIFSRNSSISSFQEFDSAFRRYMGEDEKQESNSKLDSDDVISLFETEECKSRMRENVDKEEYDQLYGDGIIVRREPISPKKVITITSPKVKVKGYTTKKGTIVPPHPKGKPQKFTPVQSKFIAVRKQKGITVKQTFKEYEQSFKSNPRTFKSVRTKFYRSPK